MLVQAHKFITEKKLLQVTSNLNIFIRNYLMRLI